MRMVLRHQVQKHQSFSVDEQQSARKARLTRYIKKAASFLAEIYQTCRANQISTVFFLAIGLGLHGASALGSACSPLTAAEEDQRARLCSLTHFELRYRGSNYRGDSSNPGNWDKTHREQRIPCEADNTARLLQRGPSLPRDGPAAHTGWTQLDKSCATSKNQNDLQLLYFQL